MAPSDWLKTQSYDRICLINSVCEGGEASQAQSSTKYDPVNC